MGPHSVNSMVTPFAEHHDQQFMIPSHLFSRLDLLEDSRPFSTQVQFPNGFLSSVAPHTLLPSLWLCLNSPKAQPNSGNELLNTSVKSSSLHLHCKRSKSPSEEGLSCNETIRKYLCDAWTTNDLQGKNDKPFFKKDCDTSRTPHMFQESSFQLPLVIDALLNENSHSSENQVDKVREYHALSVVEDISSKKLCGRNGVGINGCNYHSLDVYGVYSQDTLDIENIKEQKRGCLFSQQGTGVSQCCPQQANWSEENKDIFNHGYAYFCNFLREKKEPYSLMASDQSSRYGPSTHPSHRTPPLKASNIDQGCVESFKAMLNDTISSSRECPHYEFSKPCDLGTASDLSISITQDSGATKSTGVEFWNTNNADSSRMMCSTLHSCSPYREAFCKESGEKETIPPIDSEYGYMEKCLATSHDFFLGDVPEKKPVSCEDASACEVLMSHQGLHSGPVPDGTFYNVVNPTSSQPNLSWETSEVDIESFTTPSMSGCYYSDSLQPISKGSVQIKNSVDCNRTDHSPNDVVRNCYAKPVEVISNFGLRPYSIRSDNHKKDEEENEHKETQQAITRGRRGSLENYDTLRKEGDDFYVPFKCKAHHGVLHKQSEKCLEGDLSKSISLSCQSTVGASSGSKGLTMAQDDHTTPPVYVNNKPYTKRFEIPQLLDTRDVASHTFLYAPQSGCSDTKMYNERSLWSGQESSPSLTNILGSTGDDGSKTHALLTCQCPTAKELFKLVFFFKCLYFLRESQKAGISDADFSYFPFKSNSIESILSLFSDNLLHSMRYVFFPSSQSCCALCLKNSGITPLALLRPTGGDTEPFHTAYESTVKDDRNFTVSIEDSKRLEYLDNFNSEEVVKRLSQLSGIEDRDFLETVTEWCKQQLSLLYLRKKKNLGDCGTETSKEDESSTQKTFNEEKMAYPGSSFLSETQKPGDTFLNVSSNSMLYEHQYPEINHMISELIQKLKNLQNSFSSNNEIQEATLSSLTNVESMMKACLKQQNESLSRLPKKRVRPQGEYDLPSVHSRDDTVTYSGKLNTRDSLNTKPEFINLVKGLEPTKLQNLTNFLSCEPSPNISGFDHPNSAAHYTFVSSNGQDRVEASPMGEGLQHESVPYNEEMMACQGSCSGMNVPVASKNQRLNSDIDFFQEGFCADQQTLRDASSSHLKPTSTYIRECLVLLKIVACVAPCWACHQDSYAWHAHQLTQEFSLVESKEAYLVYYMKLFLPEKWPVTLSSAVFSRGHIVDDVILPLACQEAVEMIFLWRNNLDCFRSSKDLHFRSRQAVTGEAKKKDSIDYNVSIAVDLLGQLHYFFKYISQTWKRYVDQFPFLKPNGVTTPLSKTSVSCSPLGQLSENILPCEVKNTSKTLTCGRFPQITSFSEPLNYSSQPDEEEHHLKVENNTADSTPAYQRQMSKCHWPFSKTQEKENELRFVSKPTKFESESKADDINVFSPSGHSNSAWHDLERSTLIEPEIVNGVMDSPGNASPLQRDPGSRKRRMMIMVCTARPSSASYVRNTAKETSYSVHYVTLAQENQKKDIGQSSNILITPFNTARHGMEQTTRGNPPTTEKSNPLFEANQRTESHRDTSCHCSDLSPIHEPSYHVKGHFEGKRDGTQLHNVLSNPGSEYNQREPNQNRFESCFFSSSSSSSCQNERVSATKDSLGRVVPPLCTACSRITESEIANTPQETNRPVPWLNFTNFNSSVPQENSPYPDLPMNGEMNYSNQTTSCPGIIWNPRENSFVAYALDSTDMGQPTSRSFSAQKYGVETARLLALQWKQNCEAIYAQHMLEQQDQQQEIFSTSVTEPTTTIQKKKNQNSPGFIQQGSFQLSGYNGTPEDSKKTLNGLYLAHDDYYLLQGRHRGSKRSKNKSTGRNGTNASQLPNPPKPEIPGVYWYRNRNGWVAQWFEKGKNKHKFFAASAFGVEGAKEKAIAYRLMKLEEKRLNGW